MGFVTDISSVDNNTRKGMEVDFTFWFPFWRMVSLLAVLHVAVFDLLILATPEIIQCDLHQMMDIIILLWRVISSALASGRSMEASASHLAFII